MATVTDVNPRLKERIQDEPKRLLQPISGYEDEPLLSLEEACKPLETIIDKELQQNIVIAKLNSTEPEDGLSQDESASIHLYTMEWKVHDNSLYAVLNRTLRLADRRKLQPWFRYLKLFLTAFFKLPSCKCGTVWRGIPEDLSSLYPKGKQLAWWGVSSCSSSISVLESPQYAGTSGTRTMFSIETNSGKLIRQHSYFQHEDEILLPPGIYLEVIDKFSSADGLNIIHLREITPPYKMLADPFDLSILKQALPQVKSSSSSSSSSKKAETDSSTTVIPKPSASSSSETGKATLGEKSEKVQVTTAPKVSAYSNKKLQCKGRACVKCGHCRDWSWRPGKPRKAYTKLSDATCTRRRYMVYPRVVYESEFYADRGADYCHEHSGDTESILCQCDDNRS